MKSPIVYTICWFYSHEILTLNVLVQVKANNYLSVATCHFLYFVHYTSLNTTDTNCTRHRCSMSKISRTTRLIFFKILIPPNHTSCLRLTSETCGTQNSNMIQDLRSTNFSIKFKLTSQLHCTRHKAKTHLNV